MEKLEVDSKSGSEEEFFDCQGNFLNSGIDCIIFSFWCYFMSNLRTEKGNFDLNSPQVGLKLLKINFLVTIFEWEKNISSELNFTASNNF